MKCKLFTVGHPNLSTIPACLPSVYRMTQMTTSPILHISTLQAIKDQQWQSLRMKLVWAKQLKLVVRGTGTRLGGIFSQDDFYFGHVAGRNTSGHLQILFHCKCAGKHIYQFYFDNKEFCSQFQMGYSTWCVRTMCQHSLHTQKTTVSESN